MQPDTASSDLMDVVVIGGGSALLGFVHDDAAFLAGRIVAHQQIHHADAWHGPAPANAVASGRSYRDRGT
jgi:hypothetical protein